MKVGQAMRRWSTSGVVWGLIAILGVGSADLVAQKPAGKGAKKARATESEASEATSPADDGPPRPAILKSLDRNGDGELSDGEMKLATVSLKKLDKDRDGKLSPEEIGWPMTGDASSTGESAEDEAPEEKEEEKPAPPPRRRPPARGTAKRPARPGGTASDGESAATDESAADGHTIMERIGAGPEALMGSLKQGLEADEPDWDALKPQADEYATLATALTKVKPERGSEDSWNELTAAFEQAAKELADAVTAKDVDTARSAHQALGGTCMGCHREHRPMPQGGRPGRRPPRGE